MSHAPRIFSLSSQKEGRGEETKNILRVLTRDPAFDLLWRINYAQTNSPKSSEKFMSGILGALCETDELLETAAKLKKKDYVERRTDRGEQLELPMQSNTARTGRGKRAVLWHSFLTRTSSIITYAG
jgi:hypothetical protein